MALSEEVLATCNTIAISQRAAPEMLADVVADARPVCPSRYFGFGAILSQVHAQMIVVHVVDALQPKFRPKVQIGLREFNRILNIARSTFKNTKTVLQGRCLTIFRGRAAARGVATRARRGAIAEPWLFGQLAEIEGPDRKSGSLAPCGMS